MWNLKVMALSIIDRTLGTVPKEMRIMWNLGEFRDYQVLGNITEKSASDLRRFACLYNFQ